MIIVSIGGGLGNQMYEWAFVKAMKRHYPGTEIRLDIEHSLPKAHNGYELRDIFGIGLEECTRWDVMRLSDQYPLDSPFHKLGQICYRFLHKLGLRKSSYVFQDDFTEYYDKFFQLDPSKDYICVGVFANERYFSHIEDEIRADYQFPEIKDHENLRWKEQIQNSNSVSLHLRRGDYVTFGVPVLTETYYKRAIELVTEKAGGDCTYFAFTDDPAYVRNIFSDIPRLSVVDCNSGSQSFRDMQLMSLCRHNIIANSSFSFWGAYLNANPEKVVIAPNLPYPRCRNPFTCAGWTLLDVECDTV